MNTGYFQKGHIPWNRGLHTDTSHLRDWQFKKGHKPNNFKGFRKHNMGYIDIYNPKHPFCKKSGYVYEHRLVMEQKLGRYLKKYEVVHHINHIRDDNRPENLMLINNIGEHTALEIKLYPNKHKPNLGKKHPEETKRKIGQGVREAFKKIPLKLRRLHGFN